MYTYLSNRQSKCRVCGSIIHIGDRIAFINAAPKVRARIAIHARHVEQDVQAFRIARRQNEVV